MTAIAGVDAPGAAQARADARRRWAFRLPVGFPARLLPPDEDMGRLRYVWLIYLGTLFADPVAHARAGRATAVEWGVALAALAVFLPMYFRTYWARGRELMALVGAQLALGAALAPFNTGATVLFVYAACFAAQWERERDARRVLAAVALAGAAAGWGARVRARFWAGACGFAPAVGWVAVRQHSAARARRRLAAAAERERIARDLHDVLGHTLSLVVLKAELACKLAERDPARARAEMGDVERVSREALRQVRETVRGYRATLAGEGERARALLDAAGVRAAVDAEALGAAGAALPRAAEEALALALREGATNVARHAGAARCRVTLARDGSGATLVVEDDGRGAAAAAEGEGLRGMRERVEAAGGRVTRGAGARGRGTRLAVTLPLAASAATAPVGAS